MKIAFVEDNENMREALRRYLELEGHEVFEFGLIKEAGKAMERTDFDLFILDVMLPDGDGFRFAKRIKSESSIPVIFLTARTEESDRITGLELGADDYVVKPFSAKELVLRVNRVLKRSGAGASNRNIPQARLYSLKNSQLAIYADQHRLVLDGLPVSLTAAEWSILEFLSVKSPQVFSRSQLLEYCLDSIAEGSERTIDTHIKNLRKKLGSPGWIETVRGFGYRFEGVKADP
jgi:DNA-binding response OmpR family regulator